ncbi:MAG: hypothetical protein JWM96_288 [Alphaproteobacteria bacterium]|nr:hypothetical protein [Alphaproteobacteria bacterium]
MGFLRCKGFDPLLESIMRFTRKTLIQAVKFPKVEWQKLDVALLGEYRVRAPKASKWPA